MYEDKFATYNAVKPPKFNSNFFNRSSYTEYDEPFEKSENDSELVIEPVQESAVKKAREIIYNKPQKTITKVMDEQASFKDKKDFIDKMTKAYSDSLKAKGISSKYAKMLVAQDALESAWGTKVSGKNNLGGIKGKGTVKTTKEEINKQLKTMKQEFRDFASLKEYTDYKVDLLNNNRYHAFDGADFFNNIANGGYATASNYASTLRRVYNGLV